MSLNSEIFVDKSELLDVTNRYVNTQQRFMCVSRPRRFGKSMAADMLAAYYDCGDDTEELFEGLSISQCKVSAKYCYAAHESRLHQNDRCKRFALCLVLTVRFRSLAPWGKLFQLFI